ncbi:MAG: two-component system response regulator [Anaerolinea sp.]|nr:two-component system response regulator [Anaerolinea sp.]
MTVLKHILLVEDDLNDVEMTVNVLIKYNLANDICVVRDGAEALDNLYQRGVFSKKTGGNPVVILLDLKMPKIDGIEVLRIIKSDKNLKMIPVVILTSSSESRDLETCYELGANAYVVKPVRFADFVEAIKQIGVFWALINEPPPPGIHKT